MEAAVLNEDGVGARERARPAAENSWAFDEGEEVYPGRFALRLLGGGHRYEAYLAHDEALLSNVVVKILRPERVHDRASLEGLRAEFSALRALNHPVISRGFDAVLQGERPHISVEFLEGPRLSTLVRKFGPLPMEQLIPLATELCSALHYMHGLHIVHLDVKPKNVIMGAPPRLIDLSIARDFVDAAALTVPVGTDAYMAPEQCTAGQGLKVGRAADVWGLGVTLYEAATGELPFPGSDEETYPQVVLAPRAPDAKVVPPPVAELIEACLRKEPAERPSARELASSLEPLTASLPRRFVLSRLRPRFR
jgi:eukaryotic-like serine/threonine-protein kinase